MRHPILFAALLSVFAVACSAVKPPAHPPLATAARVDLKRYAGKWFEIARFPQWFQKDCASATAEYSRKLDGSILVVNTCIKEDGSRRSITGSAEAVDDSASRLRVKFTEKWYGGLIPVPEEGNYWVIYVSPDYQHAIVGTPDRETLWFLSRSTTLSQAEFERLKEIAKGQGFDTGRLVIDAHTKIAG